MWQKHATPQPYFVARLPVLLVALSLLLAACGGGQAEEEAASTATPVATLAPNARALPGETTVAEAAPRIETAEAEATEIVEAGEQEATAMVPDATADATSTAPTQPPGDVTEGTTATPFDVGLSDLRGYMQKSVVVRGSITELIGQHAFLLSDLVLLDGEEVLVIYDQSDFALSTQQSVLVGGVVRQFDLSTIEQATGLDLPNDQLTEFQEEPIVVADSITRIP
jgi:ABC-type Fe3+-hydroxamate transport system substrate-binding protein